MSKQLDSFHKSIKNYVINGMAVHWLGIIMTPELYAELKEYYPPLTDFFRISGTEGNRRITYKFFILVDTSIPAEVTDGFFMTHYTKEGYQEHILGRIPQIQALESFTATFQGGISIQIHNRIMGLVEVNHGTGSSYYRNVHFEEIIDALKKRKPGESGLNTFSHDGLVRNPPVATWLGSLYFNQKGIITGYEAVGRYPYSISNAELYEQPANPALIGHLFMHRTKCKYWISGICLNGWNRHTLVVPIWKEGFGNPIDFAAKAVHYFQPEEVFLFLGFNSEKTFNQIKALPRQDLWGSWYDPESIGRMRWGYLSGARFGHVIEADLLDTYGKSHTAEVFFVAEDDPDPTKWPKLKEKYFPEAWIGWPKTKQEKALAAQMKNIED
jgi:hypothetical protein